MPASYGTAFRELIINGESTLVTGKDAVINAYSNLALVAALLLGVVQISPVDQFGPELMPDLSPRLAAIIFSTVNFATLTSLVLCTISATMIVIICSQLVSDEEAIFWVSKNLRLLRFANFLLLLGFTSFVCSGIVQVMTWTPYAYSLPCIAISMVFLACMFHGIIKGVQCALDIHHARPAKSDERGRRGASRSKKPPPIGAYIVMGAEGEPYCVMNTTGTSAAS